jgi:hypothetical protein
LTPPAVTNVTITAVILTETWNCKNLFTASLMQRPHTIALTVVVHKYDIRSFFSYFHPIYSHGEPDVGFLVESKRVV